MLTKEQIAQRISREVKDGYYVNLGIGIPTLVANYVPDNLSVEFQSENGVLGMGPFPFEGEEDADHQCRKTDDYHFRRRFILRFCFQFRDDQRQKVDLTILEPWKFQKTEILPTGKFREKW
jgi:3-oxoacid CoA-transferase subunit B